MTKARSATKGRQRRTLNKLNEALDKLDKALNKYHEASSKTKLAKLSTKDLSALYVKVAALPADNLQRRKKFASDKECVSHFAAALPWMIVLRVAQQLIGRLIHDPVSWQRVMRLMDALPDSDREKLIKHIELRKGWAVRTSTAHRWVEDAKKRQPGQKKSHTRLELLAYACAHHDVLRNTWAEVLPVVNKAAKELKLGRVAGEDLYGTAENLKQAVSKERTNKRFQKQLAEMSQEMTESDLACVLHNLSARLGS